MSDTSPSGMAVSVTPSDASDLVPINTSSSGVYPRAIYIGVAGDLAVRFPGSDTTVVFVGMSAGTWLPIRPMRVMATTTTATDIVAIY